MTTYQYNATEFALLERSLIPFGVFQTVEGRPVVLVLSAGFCELFGYERDEAYRLINQDAYRDVHPDDANRVRERVQRFVGGDETIDVVYRTRSKIGWTIVHACGRHIVESGGARLGIVWFNDEGAYAVEVGRSAGAIQQGYSTALHKESLFQRSYYDYLTGLPSMTYFFDLAKLGAERLAGEGEESVLLYINLKGMKFYNRRHGFAEGDKLILEVAKLLAKHFGNECSSRLSQDHFAVYTVEKGLEERLRVVFAEAERLCGGSSLPLCVGIYRRSMGGIDVSLACDRAKLACDAIGNTPTSEFRYFDDAMLSAIELEQYLVRNLDNALRNHWIQVYYQAIVRSANGRVCDEEALSRWIDPQKGFISPAQFIPALENAGIIYKLDLYVLEQILAKMEDQRRAGLYVVPHSLNLSRSDFKATDIVEEVRKRVDAAGVDRSMITIEVTESMVGQDMEFMGAQVRRLQELGFKVWMDDFGSGYSSLELLQDIHFDLIKLDMGFMRRFDSGDKSKVMIAELVKMAIALGVDTVAEGVETRGQVDFLREVGCSKLQGFFFSQPVSFETILERHRKGIQIGFENPAESDYYTAIGGINLYDLAVIAHSSEDSMQQYFNTIPMAIYEYKDGEFRIARCNPSYRDFMSRTFAIVEVGANVAAHTMWETKRPFFRALRECAHENGQMVLDEEIGDGRTAHAIVKHIATNPVTGTSALLVAVLAIIDNKSQHSPISYTHIAKALSAEYRYLFYVDVNTDEFVEYTFDLETDGFSLERTGEDFFLASKRDAQLILFEDDQQGFISSFEKENVLQTIRTQGSFTITYRQLIDGEPHYMRMKAVRTDSDSDHIVIGVCDVDEYIKQQRRFEQTESERMAYARITALSDEFVCAYVVDVESGRFIEYDADADYSRLGLLKEGEDFFGATLRQSRVAVCEEDQKGFAAAFTESKVLEGVRRNKRYLLRYRLVLDGKLVPVVLRAGLLEEEDGEKLVVGVSRIG